MVVMDKKKVKELIEQAIIWSKQANQHSVVSNLEEALKELSKSDWVSVEDGLPPYGEEVFVTSKMAPDNVFKIRKWIAAITLMVWFGFTLRLCGLRPFTLEYEIIAIPAAFGFMRIVEKLDKI